MAAEKSGLNKSIVSYWKKGTEPKLETVLKLCETLDVHISDLYGMSPAVKNEENYKTTDEAAKMLYRLSQTTKGNNAEWQKVALIDESGEPINLSLDDNISYHYQELNLYGKAAIADYFMEHVGESDKKAKRGLLVELKRLAAIPQYQRLEATDTNGQ